MKLKRKILALIEFEDSSGYLAEFKIEKGLPFGLTELRMWIKSHSKKSIKRIKFLKGGKKQCQIIYIRSGVNVEESFLTINLK